MITLQSALRQVGQTLRHCDIEITILQNIFSYHKSQRAMLLLQECTNVKSEVEEPANWGIDSLMPFIRDTQVKLYYYLGMMVLSSKTQRKISLKIWMKASDCTLILITTKHIVLTISLP